MKTRLRQAVAIVLLTALASSAQSQESAQTLAQASACPVSRLKAGAGIDVDATARSLKIDVDDGVSMIAFPAHPLQAVYAVSVAARGARSLTIAFRKVEGAAPGYGRAFRAAVPLDAELTQRIEKAWSRAVAAASVVDDARGDDTAKCIVLDGTLYVFSSDGRYAHVLEPNGGVPTALVDIADTLRFVALESTTTGSATGSTTGRLQRQLDRIESELKNIPPQRRTKS